MDSLSAFMNKHIVPVNNNVKRRLKIDNEQVKLLCRFEIELDLTKDINKFSVPDVGIKMNEGRIPDYVAKKFQYLNQGEQWGIITLTYQKPIDNQNNGYIELIDFTAFQPYRVDLEFFKDYRREFSIEEWLDVLIRAMEYNPHNSSEMGFNSIERKIRFISRLLIFVQSNLNIIELAPKGTGKSYVFSNLSKFGWLYSGGKITRAKLFYDMNRKSQGIIFSKDFIAFDEIKTIKFGDENEMAGALKGYLESGKISFSNFTNSSSCGLILLGNIKLSKEKKPMNKSYFSDLPKLFQETALLDRFHGFIEGWKLIRINESMHLNGQTINVEYFTEILHKLRDEVIYSSVVMELLEIPKESDTRDKNAIVKIATAFLKLLFPHVTSADMIDRTEFEIFCLKPALDMRRIMKEQMALLDPEYNPEVPNITIK